MTIDKETRERFEEQLSKQTDVDGDISEMTLEELGVTMEDLEQVFTNSEIFLRREDLESLVESDDVENSSEVPIGPTHTEIRGFY